MPLPRFDKRGVAATKTENAREKKPRQRQKWCVAMGTGSNAGKANGPVGMGDGAKTKAGMSKTDLLELLDGTLVDTTALVDEMAGLRALSVSCAYGVPRVGADSKRVKDKGMLTVVDLPESTCLGGYGSVLEPAKPMRQAEEDKPNDDDVDMRFLVLAGDEVSDVRNATAPPGDRARGLRATTYPILTVLVFLRTKLATCAV